MHRRKEVPDPSARRLSVLRICIFSTRFRKSIIASSTAQVTIHPKRVIRRIVSLPSHAQLVRHIDITISTNTSRFHQLTHLTGIDLPRGSTVDTLHRLPGLALRPLFEAIFVHVVATSCLTPHKLVVFLIEVHVAAILL